MFKYFRTEFSVVTENAMVVEVRDIEGKLLSSLPTPPLYNDNCSNSLRYMCFLSFTGISHLYASLTSKNPGPMDVISQKNESNESPRAVSLKLSGSSKVQKCVAI